MVQRDKRILESALLVVRWQRGDAAAFDEIVRIWERPLFYYLRRLSASEGDAWELLQDTWLKVLKSLKSVHDPQAFPAFLYRTARNAAITRLRRPEFYAFETDVELICDDAQDDAIRDSQNAEQVHHALKQLPLLQREALTLFFLQDLSLEEMSVLLGIPIGTVKSRLHTAKQTLRKILNEGDGHAGSI
jgi:RNA polymerase sigma-70 factor (ECF subfamily)